MEQRETIIVLDYGSQYTQLIARRVREQHVYCLIYPWNAAPERVLAHNPIGLILSGGPNSVYEPGAPTLPTGTSSSRAAPPLVDAPPLVLPPWGEPLAE